MITLSGVVLKMPNKDFPADPYEGRRPDLPSEQEGPKPEEAAQPQEEGKEVWSSQPQEETASSSAEPTVSEASAKESPEPASPEPSSPELPPQQEEAVPSATPSSTTYVFTKDGFKGSFKKILLFFLLILLLGAIGFGAVKFGLPAFKGVVGPSKVTLTYWGLWEPSKVFEQVIADFEKDNPGVEIKYIQQSHKDYRERLVSSLVKGEGPDIFRFHNTWGPMLKKHLAFLPAEVYDAASFEAIFYPVVRTSLRQDTGYIGIPLGIDGLALFINEEIFSRAGKTPPTTWDELRKTALELTVYDAEGNIQIAGAALGRTENVDHWSDILAVMMLQNGASLENPTDKLAEDALSYFVLFAKTDRVWNERLPSSTVAFAHGKLAMYFGPSWRALNIKEMNPALQFRVVPLPQLPGSQITWASFWAEGVWSGSENKKVAWEFLKYLSSKETLQKLYQTQSQLRLFGEPYPRVDMAELLKNDRYVGAFVSQAPSARSWYLCSRTFDNGINDKMIKYFEDAVNAVNQGRSPKEALGVTAQGVAEILAQYGLSAGVAR